MAKIVGLGEYIPDNIRKNEDWSPELVKSFEEHLSRELVDVNSEGYQNLDPYTLQGFKQEAGDPFLGGIERRIAPDGITAFDGELAACRMALKNAGLSPKDVGVILSGTTVPEIPNFPLAYRIGHELGCTNFWGAEVDVACAGGIIQLELARNLIECGLHGSNKLVLCTQSHFMSRGIPMGHPASPCIGDGATAILVGPDNYIGHEIITIKAETHGEYYNAVTWRRKEGATQSWYKEGPDYYLGSFNKEGARDLVLNTIKLGAQTTKEALEKANLSPEDLDFFVSVNPRDWVPFGIVKQMGLTEDKTLSTFKKYGHFGGAGPWVNLQEAEKTNRIQSGNIVGVYAQGAGFTRAAAIIKW